MDPLAVLLVLVAVGLTALVVAAPLREGHGEADERAHESEIADLEAAKEARYREIREAEMDYRTGKLSEADWKAIDRELRAEAIALLRRLDALGAGEPPATAREDDAAAASDAGAESGEPAEAEHGETASTIGGAPQG